MIALPGTPELDPVTGQTITKTFVLQAPPAGRATSINDGSASVPFNTTLVFNPGSALKLQNASLYVQNQGRRRQLLGGANPNDRVEHHLVGRLDRGRQDQRSLRAEHPGPGDWGGIVFRSIDTSVNNRNLTFPIDGHVEGTEWGKAISGADDALSFINFANIRYAGGAIPLDPGQATSALSLYNSRPTVANANIAFTGVAGAVSPAAQNLVASISADFDSFREDDIARGPLLRRITDRPEQLQRDPRSGPTNRDRPSRPTRSSIPTTPRRWGERATSPSTIPCPTSWSRSSWSANSSSRARAGRPSSSTRGSTSSRAC